MRGSELAEAMTVAIGHLSNARESSVGLDRAIKNIVGPAGQFNGRDVTNYLEAFKAEMLMRNILDESRLSGFS